MGKKNSFVIVTIVRVTVAARSEKKVNAENSGN